jgi:hypothetical protein
MREIILQLFLNKQKIVQELTELQSFEKRTEQIEALIQSKHDELDKYEHLIDLFFKSVGL